MGQVELRSEQGIRCIMDPLGELTKDEGASIGSLANYLELIRAMDNRDMHTSISIKPTALGAAYDPERCSDKICEITNQAWGKGIAVEIDMEARKYLDLTMGVVKQLGSLNRGSISVAVQAYLYRTPKDILDLASGGVGIRLVKGTYSGDIGDPGEVRGVMLENVDLLHSLGRPFSVGTHDPIIIGKVTKDRSMKGLLEIGMLKGLGDDTKLRLAGRGWAVAEYVPFGSDSYSYTMRRENYLRQLLELGLEPCP
ncbi:MAG TPA: proline dehydrogenase family protein [Methanomassiliicoccales archaeon]|nr:proline dehydrogenase family protein [Methanomassiliicoccales archaeon]